MKKEDTRETKTITTPIDGDEVVIKRWLRGGEKRKIEQIVQTGIRFSMEVRSKDAKVESDKMAEMLSKAEDKAIELIVVSVNGEGEDVLDKILNMKGPDYDFVIDEINKIRKGENFTKKESVR